jgi:hypothetical protein
VPAPLRPEGTRHSDEAIVVTLIVEVQSFYRGPPCRGFANNSLSIQGPCKVLSPNVLHRVKQGYFLVGSRVSTRREVITPFIASTTSQRQIVRFVSASTRLRQQVIESEASCTNPFRRVTILTSPLGPFANGMLDCGRDAHRSGACP